VRLAEKKFQCRLADAHFEPPVVDACLVVLGQVGVRLNISIDFGDSGLTKSLFPQPRIASRRTASRLLAAIGRIIAEILF
jgi:hypothetical protein